jgi:hypothetical protein
VCYGSRAIEYEHDSAECVAVTVELNTLTLRCSTVYATYGIPNSAVVFSAACRSLPRTPVDDGVEPGQPQSIRVHDL